jgi:NAD(P)-dependent dehydrogenase (short-subunit alcohol dehydrogenase family)
VKVVVTGASQGIGEAVACAFASQPDMQLFLVARNRENLERVAKSCREQGAHATYIECDVTQDEQVDRMAQTVLKDGEAPDIVVNNAGRFVPGRLVETSPDQFREQLDVNVTSAFLVSRSFVPAMIRRGGGHLFFLASVASIQGYAGGAAYCAAKHGVLGLARVLREETKDNGLRVTAVLPGATRTPSWDGLGIPEDRFIPATDIAQTIVDVARLGDRTVVEEILIRPQPGDLAV